MKLTVHEMTVFAVLGAMMYVSKIMLEGIPNVHLLGVFTISFTLVYRKKALYAIYVFVFLLGLFSGFSLWWIPHLYLWTILWGVVLLLPEKMPRKLAPIIYMTVCSLHGFLYGTLYSPFQALAFGLDLKGMAAWIAAGIPYDVIHGVSNFFCGILIVPITIALKKADKK